MTILFPEYLPVLIYKITMAQGFSENWDYNVPQMLNERRILKYPGVGVWGCVFWSYLLDLFVSASIIAKWWE